MPVWTNIGEMMMMMMMRQSFGVRSGDGGGRRSVLARTAVMVMVVGLSFSLTSTIFSYYHPSLLLPHYALWGVLRDPFSNCSRRICCISPGRSSQAQQYTRCLRHCLFSL